MPIVFKLKFKSFDPAKMVSTVKPRFNRFECAIDKDALFCYDTCDFGFVNAVKPLGNYLNWGFF